MKKILFIIGIIATIALVIFAIISLRYSGLMQPSVDQRPGFGSQNGGDYQDFGGSNSNEVEEDIYFEETVDRSNLAEVELLSSLIKPKTPQGTLALQLLESDAYQIYSCKDPVTQIETPVLSFIAKYTPNRNGINTFDETFGAVYGWSPYVAQDLGELLWPANFDPSFAQPLKFENIPGTDEYKANVGTTGETVYYTWVLKSYVLFSASSKCMHQLMMALDHTLDYEHDHDHGE